MCHDFRPEESPSENGALERLEREREGESHSGQSNIRGREPSRDILSLHVSFSKWQPLPLFCSLLPTSANLLSQKLFPDESVPK